MHLYKQILIAKSYKIASVANITKLDSYRERKPRGGGAGLETYSRASFLPLCAVKSMNRTRDFTNGSDRSVIVLWNI